ncbi:MAG: 50S ribosomal protein L18a [Candidatus Methanomethylophilaceae archaeon]|nr:50S ribosomal protein L18a [Candidatus Methanomethylophilaceae archaeon]
MKAFRITGTYANPRKRQDFSIEMSGIDEVAVREKALSTLGSKHKLKRREIEIESIVEVPRDQVQSHVVQYEIGE